MDEINQVPSEKFLICLSQFVSEQNKTISQELFQTTGQLINKQQADIYSDSRPRKTKEQSEQGENRQHAEQRAQQLLAYTLTVQKETEERRARVAQGSTFAAAHRV